MVPASDDPCISCGTLHADCDEGCCDECRDTRTDAHHPTLVPPDGSAGIAWAR